MRVRLPFGREMPEMRGSGEIINNTRPGSQVVIRNPTKHGTALSANECNTGALHWNYGHITENAFR